MSLRLRLRATGRLSFSHVTVTWCKLGDRDVADPPICTSPYPYGLAGSSEVLVDLPFSSGGHGNYVRTPTKLYAESE